MRSYEVVFIVDPTLENEEAEKILERVVQVLSEQGASVANVDRWGRRRLAYEIAGHRDGNYTVISFQGPSQAGAELERVLRITDGVIRHLLVKQEDE